MTELIGHDLGIGTRLTGADIRLVPGELVAVVGPNGSGKSTLMRLLAGLLPADRGTVLLGGSEIARINPRARARQLAYLPQRTDVAWPISVAETVALGRFAFGSAEMARGSEDAIAWLDEVGCGHLALRSTSNLSGGELALVALARVFAAQTPLLLLDEPVAALDPKRQIDIMTRLAARSRGGQGIMVILHDLNLAAQFADRILWMKQGRIAAECTTDAALIEANTARIFDVSAQVICEDDKRIKGVFVALNHRSN